MTSINNSNAIKEEFITNVAEKALRELLEALDAARAKGFDPRGFDLQDSVEEARRVVKELEPIELNEDQKELQETLLRKGLLGHQFDLIVFYCEGEGLISSSQLPNGNMKGKIECLVRYADTDKLRQIIEKHFPWMLK